MSYDDTIAECRRRGYSDPEILAVLTLAIDQGIPEGFLDQLDSYRAKGQSSADPWYNIAAICNLPADQWQTYKNHLYTHLDAAVALMQPKKDDPVSVLRTNVDFAKRIGSDRVGNEYVYGGNWNPFDKSVGTDCSGCVIDICDAARNGTAMSWTRHGMSTESWRPIEVGQTGTIFNTVCVASPKDFPPDAAVKIAIHHGPGGGANSHMWCEVDGVRFESNGSDGCVTGSRARSVYDTSYANDWHYIPPIVGDVPQGGNTVTRPDFNEYAIWSPNNSSRGGINPTMFLLHTEEGNSNADGLAHYLANPASQASYHYTISKGVNDDGVTVVDCVDTNAASWSVGDANSRSINLCFAGSKASWTRQDWLTKAGRAIDVAAYLAVQDAKKYGFSTLVVPPPYKNGTPGISDHRWVTDVFGWGTHTDVGPNFPWDVLIVSVNKYAGTPAPTPGGFLMALNDAEQQELLDKTRYIFDQLGPGFDDWGADGDLGKNAKGQRRTFRAGLAALMRKAGA